MHPAVLSGYPVTLCSLCLCGYLSLSCHEIDAHHHFWRYDPAEYGWIDDSMSVLRRDFLPADLEREIEAVGIDGVITVQARQSLAETRWLLRARGGALVREGRRRLGAAGRSRT